MDLTLVHGSAKHKIDVESTASVEDLMEIVDRTTQIPTFNQKLIYKGISLKKDTGMSLHELGVKNNSKIMVIGQKHDPAEEAILKKMQGLQKSANDIREHVKDLRLNLDSVKKGFLEKSLVEKSAEQLKKRLLSCTEKGMKSIEVLDEIELHERHKDARAKRKQIINEIQAILDDCDKLADEIKSLVD